MAKKKLVREQRGATSVPTPAPKVSLRIIPLVCEVSPGSTRPLSVTYPSSRDRGPPTPPPHRPRDGAASRRRLDSTGLAGGAGGTRVEAARPQAPHAPPPTLALRRACASGPATLTRAHAHPLAALPRPERRRRLVPGPSSRLARGLGGGRPRRSRLR